MYNDLVIDFLDNNEISNYVINLDGTIDVHGRVMLYSYSGIELPSYIQFGKVLGNFSCSCLNITSLVGFPLHIGGYLMCYFGKIAPSYENFEILHRYSGCLYIEPELDVLYQKYCRMKKRMGSIDEIIY